jgi:hypothetical protein
MNLSNLRIGGRPPLFWCAQFHLRLTNSLCQRKIVRGEPNAIVENVARDLGKRFPSSISLNSLVLHMKNEKGKSD